MEALATESGRLLLTQGVLGLCVLALSIVVVILYRANVACQSGRIAAVEGLIGECTRCITNVSQHIAMSTAASQTANSVNESRLIALANLNQSVEALERAVVDLREETRRRP